MNHDYAFIQKKSDAHFYPHIFIIGKIYSQTQKKLFGKGFGITLTLIEDGVMNWYASLNGMKQVGEQCLAIVRKNPALVHKFKKKFCQLAPRMLSIANEIGNKKIKKFSNPELWRLMDKYVKNYEKIYLWSEPIVLGLNDSLGSYLREYLTKISMDKTKIGQDYNILIAPIEASFVKKEEDQFLEFALKVAEKKITNIDPWIRKHAQKFGWIPYDYGVYIWDESYFKVILDRILLEGDIRKKIQENKNYLRELPNKQLEIERALKIDSYHKKLFNAIRDATFILDYKKEIFTKTHLQASKLLTEIANRLNINKILVQYHTPKELKRSLVHGVLIPRIKLESRFHYSLIKWQDEDVEFIEGPHGKVYLNKFLTKKESFNAKIDGVIASAGKYIGPVKVLKSASEIGKVNKGDIIVVAMTSPDYVAAMRLAGAIITDEGGVMCHAAIVSRELGIPCVVGTKNSTKILQDGEIVEVNANHNSVKILRKK